MAPYLVSKDDVVDVVAHLDAISTSTIIDTPTLVARQNVATVTAITESCGGTNLSGGAIAGIVLGSIFGTLLVLWIIRSCMTLSGPSKEREAWHHYVDPATEKRRRHRSKHSGHGARSHSRASHRSVGVSAPPPVVVQDYSRRSGGQPTYVYADTRGRRSSRDY